MDIPSIKLKPSFFQGEDTIAISQNLLGKFLVSNIEGEITSGMIVEVEAYLGAEDRACHGFGRRRTKRTEVLYLAGGHWYVYLCYGLHSLLNVTTHVADEPHAILIRAIEPCEGIGLMLKRRKFDRVRYNLTAGPGSLCVAMGVTTAFTGQAMDEKLWIEDRGITINKDQIITSPRIGVEYAKEDALLPYRLFIKDNPWVSKRSKRSED